MTTNWYITLGIQISNQLVWVVRGYKGGPPNDIPDNQLLTLVGDGDTITFEQSSNGAVTLTGLRYTSYPIGNGSAKCLVNHDGAFVSPGDFIPLNQQQDTTFTLQSVPPMFSDYYITLHVSWSAAFEHDDSGEDEQGPGGGSGTMTGRLHGNSGDLGLTVP